MWCRATRASSTVLHARARSTVSPSLAHPAHVVHERDSLARTVYRVSRYYGRHTDDPIFKFLNALDKTPSAKVPLHSLRRSGVHLEQLVRWKPFVVAPDLHTAFPHAKKHALHVLTNPLDTSSPLSRHGSPQFPRMPTWVALFLICYRVTTPAEAETALHLAHHQLGRARFHLRPSLLIFAACWLARHNSLVSLKHAVTTFLDLPIKPSAVEYQVLLQVLLHASRSRSSCSVILLVLEDMLEHGLPLDRVTYDALLASPFLTPELGMTVAQHMHAHQHSPTVKDLECWIGLFTKAGWKKRAGRCLNLLRARQIKHGASTATFGTDAQTWGVEQVMTVPQTWYMSAFTSSTFLEAYVLRTTAAQERHRSANDDLPAVGGAADVSTPSAAPASVPRMPGGHRLKKASRAQIWRSILRVASVDPDISVKTLMHACEQATTAEAEPSSDVVLRLIVIEGLLQRRAYADALRVWNAIAKRKEALMPYMLTVGIKVLTLAGRLREAFRFILEAGARSRANARQLSLVDTQVVNVFMISLQRVGRHDVVFELWDNLERVFGVCPDEYTVAILFKAARFADKCDPSLMDALKDLGLSRFHTDSPSPPQTQTRHEAIAALEHLFADERRAVSGKWRGERAGAVALRIAQELFLGNWPTLRAVRPPARASRASAAAQVAHPVTDLMRTVLGRSEPSTAADPPRTARAPALRAVVPTDIVFRAYFDLLAAEGRAPEVPRALAWMEALCVRPSRGTLAAALVYWAEVSMDAPLIEYWKGGSGEYSRLVRWMREWVGEERMPSAADIGVHIRRVNFFRNMRYRGPASAVDLSEGEEREE